MIRDSGARSRARSHPVRATEDADAGFDEFYRHSFDRVSRSLTALTRDSRAVDDATQEAFVLARHDWGKIAAYDKPEAWVFKVALRKLRRIHPSRPEQPFDHSEVDSQSIAIADHAEHVVQRDELRAAIRALPPRQAEVITLHYLCDYSISDVASTLDIGDSTVRSHLTHAYKRLQLLLGPLDEACQEDAS